jgi:cytochrome c peroxidase
MMRTDPRYRSLVPDASPEDPDPFTIANVTKALASFQRSIISARTPYDSYYYGGNEDAISESAKSGEVLFYNLPGRFSYPVPNLGLYEHTRRSVDVGKFKAPTLRNIALTAPYMHDGSIP